MLMRSPVLPYPKLELDSGLPTVHTTCADALYLAVLDEAQPSYALRTALDGLRAFTASLNSMLSTKSAKIDPGLIDKHTTYYLHLLLDGMGNDESKEAELLRLAAILLLRPVCRSVWLTRSTALGERLLELSRLRKTCETLEGVRVAVALAGTLAFESPELREAFVVHGRQCAICHSGQRARQWSQVREFMRAFIWVEEIHEAPLHTAWQKMSHR